MADLTYKTAQVNGIFLAYVDRGEGPLILLLHGFPETAYSWRHQIGALAEAGYRVIAPDMRGYGRSSAPAAIEEYSYFRIVGDLVALMDELGHADAVVVGHDMGAFAAWYMALLVPHRVRAVAGLSVALRKRWTEPPTTVFERGYGPGFYQVLFQEPDVVDAQLAACVDTFLPSVLVGLSADAAVPIDSLAVPPGKQFDELFPAVKELPDWLREDDLSVYVAAFKRSGFTGPLNWYRNIDQDWAHLAPWASAPVRVPAIYMTGEQDISYRIAAQTGGMADMSQTVTDLRETIVVPDCGHWINQERPGAVNEAILRLAESVR